VSAVTFTGRGSWLPSWPLIASKLLVLRKRRALMIATLLFTVGVPVIFLGARLLFHAFDPKTYAPAGNPGVFSTLSGTIADFGFIIAVTVGATVGTTDLTDGVFRHLVITGRSRLALFLARIPAGLAVLLPLAGVGFAIVCLVTAFFGTPQPTSLNANGINIPVQLSQGQLQTWIADHPAQSGNALGTGPQSPAAARAMAATEITSIYTQYTHDEAITLNPSDSTMTEAGLWIELDLLVGFTVGLGLGSLMGQRTVPIILLIVLDIIITPPLAASTLPYFINGQRALVGVAIDQIEPQTLIGQGDVTGHLVGRIGAGNTGQALAQSGLGVNQALVMPTWALVVVIGGWIVGWSAIGAWRMITRDA
jgi:hypothetical protein